MFLNLGNLNFGILFFLGIQSDGAGAGVNVMFLNGLPVDVPAGMELYPLLERISAEVHLPDVSLWYTVAAQPHTAWQMHTQQ